jgi:hypothetical protein
MAAPTIQAILTAIATRLTPVIRATDYAPGQINPPQAIIRCPPIPSYYTGMGDRRPILEVSVTVLVSPALDWASQLALAGYADPDSPTSIPKAIATDQTLGGVVGQCMVTSFEPVDNEDVGSLGYFGGRFVLRVTT